MNLSSVQSKGLGNLKKQLAMRGVFLILLGFGQCLLGKFHAPLLGAILILLGVLNVLVRKRAMFRVNGPILLAASALNLVSISQFLPGMFRDVAFYVPEDPQYCSLLGLLGSIQFVWGMLELRAVSRHAVVAGLLILAFANFWTWGMLRLIPSAGLLVLGVLNFGIRRRAILIVNAIFLLFLGGVSISGQLDGWTWLGIIQLVWGLEQVFRCAISFERGDEKVGLLETSDDEAVRSRALRVANILSLLGSATMMLYLPLAMRSLYLRFFWYTGVVIHRLATPIIGLGPGVVVLHRANSGKRWVALHSLITGGLMLGYVIVLQAADSVHVLRTTSMLVVPIGACHLLSGVLRLRAVTRLHIESKNRAMKHCWWGLLSIIVACLAVFSGVHVLRSWRTAQHLRALSEQRDLVVVWKAVAHAGNHKIARAVPDLILIMRKYEIPLYRMEAAEALGRIGSTEAVDALIAEVERETPAATSATWGLFIASDERSIPALLEALESKDDGLRKGAAIALSRFDREECVPGLVASLEDRDSSIDSPIIRAPLEKEGVSPVVLAFIRDSISGSKEMAEYCASKLRQLTGQSFGYDAKESKENRTRALEEWKAWLENSEQQ